MFQIQYIKKLLLLLPLLAATRLATAQALPEADATGTEQDCGLTISGKVLDHDTREPLVGATIFMVEQNKATMTDEYGNYHFHHLCQGNYTLKVSYVGYEEERISFRMVASTVRNLTLHTDSRVLHSVEVTGSRLTEQPQASQTLSGRELEETRGLSLGESLKRLSGVSSIQTGPNVSKPVIHGLFGNRILILNNGVRHEAQQWGDEHAPEIDPLNASEMKVVKGAAGVRYGSDAIGGIVLVNPKPLPDSAGVRGEVNLIGSTNNRMGAAAAMVEGKMAKLPPLSWRLHTSVKKAGSASTPDYTLKNTGFEEQNLSATVAYRKPTFGSEVYYSYFHSKLGVLSSAHIGSPTDLFNAIQRERPEETGDFSYTIERPYQDVTHHLLKAKGFVQTGELGELQFTYAFQQNLRNEFDKHRPRSDGKAELHLDLATHSTELVWEHKPLGNFSGSVGASTLWQNNTYQNRYFIPFYRNFTNGVFWTERWRKDNLQLEAGVRYDHQDLRIRKRENDSTVIRPEYEFHNLSGSLGAMYDLGYHLTLSSNLSYASRAPHANELFAEGVHHGTATYEHGDPNLNSEHATNAVATVNYHSNRRLNGEVSVYSNFIQDYIYLQPSGEVIQTIRGAFPMAQYQQTDARFWGVDLNLQYAFTDKFMLESKGSLVRAENTRDGSYLPFVPADRIDNTLRYQLGALGNGGLTKAYVALGGLAVARQKRADAHSEPFLLPPDGYFLVHAEAGATVRVGGQRLEVGITGNNLLNTTYRDYQNRLRYYADEVGRLLMFRVKIPLTFSKG